MYTNPKIMAVQFWTKYKGDVEVNVWPGVASETDSTQIIPSGTTPITSDFLPHVVNIGDNAVDDNGIAINIALLGDGVTPNMQHFCVGVTFSDGPFLFKDCESSKDINTISFMNIQKCYSSNTEGPWIEQSSLCIEAFTADADASSGEDDCLEFPCGKNGAKVELCHSPPGKSSKMKTLCIDPTSVQDHLAHGDTCGPCA